MKIMEPEITTYSTAEIVVVTAMTAIMPSIQN